MNMPMCSRCKKNIAVVFITKIEGPDKTTQEGLCLKCARELGVKPLDNIMEQMGITEDDLEALSGEIGSLSDLNDLVPAGSDGTDDDAPHETDPVAAGTLPGQPAGGSQEETRTRSSRKEDKKRKYLNNYCENLTQKAAEGRIDHIVGRDRETDRVIQILNRRQKNNPCLIGEPGVGKTAVAEGLAVRINEGRIPFKMRNKEVHLLDLTALVAGTQFRGQFESRMKGLIDEVKRIGNIILVIDEVHNIVGTGDSEGSMNAANILKPALARGDIQVIGATTLKEYRKYIEKDAALERRFQPVYIGEPSVAETTEILKGIRSYYETFHGVTVSDEMCRRAAETSERYITDRFLPDKAIDLIDEACSRLNLDSPQLSEIPELQNELERLQAQLDELTQSSARAEEEETYAKIATCRSRILQVEAQLHELLTKPAPQVDEQLLAEVIEIWTGIPASKVAAQESARLRGKDALKPRPLSLFRGLPVCSLTPLQTGAAQKSAPHPGTFPLLSVRPALRFRAQRPCRCCAALRPMPSACHNNCPHSLRIPQVHPVQSSVQTYRDPRKNKKRRRFLPLSAFLSSWIRKVHNCHILSRAF